VTIDEIFREGDQDEGERRLPNLLKALVCRRNRIFGTHRRGFEGMAGSPPTLGF
jgi:hypothetical protein